MSAEVARRLSNSLTKLTKKRASPSSSSAQTDPAAPTSARRKPKTSEASEAHDHGEGASSGISEEMRRKLQLPRNRFDSGQLRLA